MMEHVEDIGDIVFSELKKYDFTEADAFVSFKKSWQIVGGANKIEHVNFRQNIGLGIRVIIRKKIGFFATTVSKREDIRYAINKAYKIAKTVNEDKNWVSLPRNLGSTRVEGIFDKKIDELSSDELIKLFLVGLEVIKTDKNAYLARGKISGGVARMGIFTSNGDSLVKKESLASTMFEINYKKNGIVGMGYEYDYSRMWNLSIESVAEKALSYAKKSAEATKIKTINKLSVIWHNRFSLKILDNMLSTTITADAVQQKRSPYINKIGEQIFDENLTIIDEGLRPAGLGTAPFDDEGIPQQNTTIVEKGVLRNFLYDTYTANKDKCKSTGNASRSYKSLPRPSPHDIVIKPGTATLEDMICNISEGILIIDTIGEWLSDPISGAINATVTLGAYVEKGEIKNFVKGFIVSGNWFEIAKSGIRTIGRDIRHDLGVSAPSIWIDKMVIATD